MTDTNKEQMLEVIKRDYEAARKLAREIWLISDADGNNNDRYFYECGFVAGLNYNIDGSLREIEPKYSKEFLKFAENLFKEQQNYEN